MTAPQTVAVTGAGGFLGRELVRQLRSTGVRVIAISRQARFDDPDVIVARPGLHDTPALAQAIRGTSAVFHLAAHVHDLTSADDGALQRSITLGGTLALLDAAERAEVPQVILASSLAVFGENGSRVLSEDGVCRPTTAYGQAKLEAEEALRAFTARTGALGAAVRPAMLYGVSCPGNLPRMIHAIRFGWFPPIPEFGNCRSMVSVEDAAMAMRLAWKAQVAGGRSFIITDGQAYSTRQIYEWILTAIDRPIPRWRIPRIVLRAAAVVGDVAGQALHRRLPFDSRAYSRLAGSACYCSVRAADELGFRPTVALPEVLPAMVRFSAPGAG